MSEPTVRLDVALQRDGHARSRTHARRIIEEGRARIDGKLAEKPSVQVTADARLEVEQVPDGGEYASRAAHKLLGALDDLGIDPAGMRCLDAGASHGGFTDVLLRRGVDRVVAVDIGHGQLLPRLAADPRVTVIDGTSVRDLTPELIGGAAQLVVADLSFISLRTVIESLARATVIGGELLLMVKPQFEVGRAALPRSGVVSDAAQRASAVARVAAAAIEVGLVPCAVGPSALHGQDGNRESFLHLRRAREDSQVRTDCCDMIEDAVRADRVMHIRAPEITGTEGKR